MSNGPKRSPDATGDLNRYPFPRLLFFLLKKKFTGELQLSLAERQWTGRVYFREGTPVYTDIPSSQDVLGRVLLERGLITQTAYDRSLEALAAAGDKEVRQGQLLLQQGALTEDELVEGLRIQLGRKLMRVFPHIDFKFALFSGDHDYGANGLGARITADPFWLIHHGVCQFLDSKHMTPELSKVRGKWLQLHAGFEKVKARFDLTEDDLALVRFMGQQPMTFEQIMRSSHMGPVETEMLLYSLWVSEMLVLSDEHPARTEVPSDVVAAAVAAMADEMTPAGMSDSEVPAAPAVAAPPAAAPGMELPRTRAELETSRGDAGAQLLAAGKHRKLVKEAFNRVQDQDHWEVLGVPRGAEKQQIRDAYFAMAKVYHPDRCNALGLKEVVDLAEDVFRRISEAQTVLLDDEALKDYEGQLEGKPSKQQLAGALEAEFVFQKGLFYLRKKDYTTAMQHFEDAYKLNPAEGEHLAYMAWTLYSDPTAGGPSTISRAEKWLKEALEISPRSAETYYFLGEIYANMGKERDAVKMLNQCLEVKPEHIDAARHLRVIRMRQDKKKAEELKQQGFLGRFLRGGLGDKKDDKKKKKGRKGGGWR